MMLLLDINDRVIGTYSRPVTTSVVIVQLGVHRNIVYQHPEAIDNLQQVQLLRMQTISINGVRALKINEPTPDDLFKHEGFAVWNGSGS